MDYHITLLTIGFAESHDILFAKEVNEQLNYPHHVLEIDPKTFPSIPSPFMKKSRLTIYPGMKIIAFYYVSKLAQSWESIP